MDIKAIRGKLGLSQDKFAAKIGVAPYTVRRWEAGVNEPSPLAQEKIKGIMEKNAKRS